jgi:hypothetical protein
VPAYVIGSMEFVLLMDLLSRYYSSNTLYACLKEDNVLRNDERFLSIFEVWKLMYMHDS